MSSHVPYLYFRIKKHLESSVKNLIAYLTHLCFDIKNWWEKDGYYE